MGDISIMNHLEVNIEEFSFGSLGAIEVGIENIAFDAYAGEVLCIVGKNGSCKTTLGKILAGQLTDYDGNVVLSSAPQLDDGRFTAYLPQEYPLLPWRSVQDNLYFGLEMFGLEMVLPSWLEEFLLASDINGHLGKLPNELSGGQRQQVALIQGLALDPPLIIMDEPYSALSQTATTRVKDLVGQLRKQGKIVVQIVHDFGIAVDTSTRILVMNATEPGRYTIVADMRIDPLAKQDELRRQPLISDIGRLCFQDAMTPLSQEYIKQEESSLQGGSEVIIVALDPQREYRVGGDFSFLSIVAENLKRGIRYTYAFPGYAHGESTDEALRGGSSAVGKLLNELQSVSMLSRSELKELVTIYLVEPTEFRFADFLIAFKDGVPDDGWEFPTTHPDIIFQTPISKLEEKLEAVREVFANTAVAKQVFPS